MIQCVLYLSVSNGLMTKNCQLFFFCVCAPKRGAESWSQVFLAKTEETRDKNHNMSQHMHIL